MARLLGIDTGGTHTDAVIVDDQAQGSQVIAHAKALTTRHDLAIGVRNAIGAVLSSAIEASGLRLVSLSTTLATNALVEGQGGRVCLILIGFDHGTVERGGLSTAIGRDPVIHLAGGHDATGNRQADLDLDDARRAISEVSASVQGFAIVAHFGTRDPVDEIRVRDLIISVCDCPVTCGHDLSSSLNGPKRAVTSVLNARLIGTISLLIAATHRALAEAGIKAPLMLVRGDGSLVSASFARTRPIETILSGPAASLIGAAHLTGLSDAVVSDIGGTTTDIAVLRAGRPLLSPRGATVGGHQTMVEAVSMRTHGLGGDSCVRADNTRFGAHLTLGPDRVLPICVLASEFGNDVHAMLARQVAQPAPRADDGDFILRPKGQDTPVGLRDQDLALWKAIPDTPVLVNDIVKTRLQRSSLDRLIARKLVQRASFTPTDAAHVLNLQSGWDADAARSAALLMARQREAGGRAIAETPEHLSEIAVQTLVRRSSEVILDAALAHDGFEEAEPSRIALAQAAMAGHRGVARLSIGLDLPLVGLGASAPLYYPSIAERLGTSAVVPPEAGVANAVGAVVGHVRITRTATVIKSDTSAYRIGGISVPHVTATVDDAREASLTALIAEARTDAERAGAGEIEIETSWDEKTATIEGQPVFIEATATVSAVGRPRLDRASAE
ncbi:MAG: hydantoinase/oxoprolinase family protein [Pseudomonadota bacterium]